MVMHCLQFVSIAIVFVATLSASVRGAQPAEGSQVLEKIVQDWQRRQEIGSVKYVVEGQQFYAKGSIKEGSPPQDAVYPEKRTYFIDFDGDRIRKEGQKVEFFDDVDQFLNVFRVYLYDGEEVQQFLPRERNEELFAMWEWEINVKLCHEKGIESFFDKADRPILLAHGLISGRELRFSATGRLRRQQTPSVPK